MGVILPEGVFALMESSNNDAIHPDSLVEHQPEDTDGPLLNNSAPPPDSPDNSRNRLTTRHLSSKIKHGSTLSPISIGLPVMLGFLVMFVIEYFSPFPPHPGHQNRHHHRLSSPTTTSRIGERENDVVDGISSLEMGQPQDPLISSTNHLIPPHLTTATSTTSSSFQNSVYPTVIGLSIHCAADGLAMGAASASSQVGLETIVFLAVLIHKAPSAFALTTYLMQHQSSKRRIRWIVMFVSAVSPLVAFFVAVLSSVRAYDVSQSSSIISDSGAGGMLLASGGSFIYVSTIHVLGDAMSEKSNSRGLFLVLGMLTPLLFTWLIH